MSAPYDPERPGSPSLDEEAPGASGASSDRWRRIAEMTCSAAYSLRVEPDGAVAIEWVGPRIVELLGVTVAEIEQGPRVVADLVVFPEDAAELSDLLARVVAGARVSKDHRLRTRSGETRWVKSLASPVRDETGRVAFVDGAFVDITERARAAAALAEGEERYRSVVAALEEGITLHDADGRVLAANASASHILGTSASAMVGTSPFDTLVYQRIPAGWGSVWQVEEEPRPFPEQEHPLALALREGRPTTGIVAGLCTSPGMYRWIKLSALPISSGGAARAVCSFSDITEARREERLRRRTEQNFRALIEISPDAVAVYQAGRVVYANPCMLSLLGYERPEEMIGADVLQFVYPDDRPMVAERVRKATIGLEAPLNEERLLRKDGSPVSVEAVSLPIFYDDAPATLVHARDLTDRKRLEAQLVMADRLASVGKLAATVGHEINNPLAYVLTNLDLALERLGDLRAVDREIVEMLREAREGAERVRTIVRDLKVFSRGETEEKTRVDPRRVLDSCANMAKGEIRTRARLVKHYDDDTPRVVANEARLGQVLLNLLVNAAHAIPEDAPGENEITVSTGADARGRVVIGVRDTGMGIPEDVKRHIFEPFFTTKTGGLGTGLGLPICQSIVSALGGEIAVESEVGRGTAFRVFLPAAPECEGPASQRM